MYELKYETINHKKNSKIGMVNIFTNNSSHKVLEDKSQFLKMSPKLVKLVFLDSEKIQG